MGGPAKRGAETPKEKPPVLSDAEASSVAALLPLQTGFVYCGIWYWIFWPNGSGIVIVT